MDQQESYPNVFKKKKEKNLSPGRLRTGRILSVIISVLLLHAILITAFQTACYASSDFYRDEYEKYGVTDDLEMSMDDTMYVTENMMDYLIGERPSLSGLVITSGGQEREFFNESEASHMADVQKLFLIGLMSRNIALIIVLAVWIALNSFYIPFMKDFPGIFRKTAAVYVVLLGAFGAAIAMNFNKVFVIFHKIFFPQGNWIFDPKESLMINMLPEGFFYDMTKRIVLIFALMLAAAFLITYLMTYWRKRREYLAAERQKNSLPE